jgi:hypothetical protein
LLTGVRYYDWDNQKLYSFKSINIQNTLLHDGNLTSWWSRFATEAHNMTLLHVQTKGSLRLDEFSPSFIRLSLFCKYSNCTKSSFCVAMKYYTCFVYYTCIHVTCICCSAFPFHFVNLDFLDARSSIPNNWLPLWLSLYCGDWW